jgi:hypothetical protein
MIFSYQISGNAKAETHLHIDQSPSPTFLGHRLDLVDQSFLLSTLSTLRGHVLFLSVGPRYESSSTAAQISRPSQALVSYFGLCQARRKRKAFLSHHV